MQIDFNESNNQINRQMADICSSKTNLRDLQKISEFFTSNEWKNIKENTCGDSAYEVANQVLSTFNHEFIIFNNGKILFDKHNIFEQMSSEEKEFLEVVDRKTDNKVYRMNDFIFQHIGSCYSIKLISDSGDYNWSFDIVNSDATPIATISSTTSSTISGYKTYYYATYEILPLVDGVIPTGTYIFTTQSQSSREGSSETNLGSFSISSLVNADGTITITVVVNTDIDVVANVPITYGPFLTSYNPSWQ